MRRKVASRHFTSCRWPACDQRQGTPRASTEARLRPFFSPIRGVRPHAFVARGALCMPHRCFAAPGDAPPSRRIRRSCLPQAEKKASAVAIVESVVNPRWHYRIHAAKPSTGSPYATQNDGGKRSVGGNRLASRAGVVRRYWRPSVRVTTGTNGSTLAKTHPKTVHDFTQTSYHLFTDKF